MKRKAVFFDRDGVLNYAVLRNGKTFPPPTLDDLRIPPDAFSALTSLKAAGYLLVGATNQPDVARGTTPRQTVEAINLKLMQELPLDEIRVCYHDNQDNCLCRKPQPGLLLEAASIHAIDLSNSIMIGDRAKDLEAGARVGCKTIWMRYDHTLEEVQGSDFIATSLSEAAQWIQALQNI